MFSCLSRIKYSIMKVSSIKPPIHPTACKIIVIDSPSVKQYDLAEVFSLFRKSLPYGKVWNYEHTTISIFSVKGLFDMERRFQNTERGKSYQDAGRVLL